jgi:anti-sigma factor RsiW
MKCGRVRKNLVLFLDGDLPSPEAEVARSHLAGCEACREEVELLRSTLSIALERARQKQAPPPQDNFASLFWRKERERRRKDGVLPAGRLFPWHRRVWVTRYAMASVVAVAVIGIAIFAVLQGDKRGTPGGPGRPAIEVRKGRVVPPETGSLAHIEAQLQELEAAVRRLGARTDNSVRLSGSEMREVYAAIGLASANNYRNVLNMGDIAARKYAHVASLFPGTSAGQQAEKMLSRLN